MVASSAGDALLASKKRSLGVRWPITWRCTALDVTHTSLGQLVGWLRSALQPS